mgnify:CR=1 FL=1
MINSSSSVIPRFPSVHLPEVQVADEESEVASFFKVSHIVAKKLNEVVSNPGAFFSLSQIEIPQFIAIPCEIFPDQAEGNVQPPY